MLRVDADRRRVSDPGVEGPLEVHDEDLAHIVANPLLEDGNQKVAVSLRSHGPWRGLSLLVPAVQRCGNSKAQALLRASRIGHALDDRGELDELNTRLPEKTVYLKRPGCRFTGHAGQHVVLDLMLLQEPEPAHGLLKGSAALAIPAVAVVNLLRAVQADPDHEIVPFQKPAPLVVEQRPVGLQRVA